MRAEDRPSFLVLSRDSDILMLVDRHTQVSDIFASVYDLDDNSRAIALDHYCGNDASLRRDVERLLALHVESERFLESPMVPTDLASDSLDDHKILSDLVGTRIGRYELRRVIASGGMGTVFEAWQDDPPRSVALKLMRTGMMSAAARRRFEYESHILARLNHPHVAHVYEAGHHDGLSHAPWFAMEFVSEAKPITRYADQQALDVRRRVELFVSVIEAVHYGHQKGVIHRDLKPGNILIDERGKPKIIDFGVAAMTGTDVATATLKTNAGQLVGTLPYMSPEQVAIGPNHADPDVRSDVYSLGVVLYELLSGRVPREIAHLPLMEALAVLHESPSPSPLSGRHSAVRLDRDLETIVFAALEHEPHRRYGSALDMAQDMRRWLNREPIAARPASARYRMAMFIRRNRIGVGAAAVIAVTLIAATVIALNSYARERHHRDVAEQQAREMEQVIGFQQAVLRDIDPQAMGHDLIEHVLRQVAAGARMSGANTAFDEPPMWFDQALRSINEVDLVRSAVHRHILARASTAIDHEFGTQPLVQASLRESLARIYETLGMYGESIRQVQQVLDLRHRELGADDRSTIRSLHSMALLLQRNGRVNEAVAYAREALERRRRILGEDHVATVQSWNLLGLALYKQNAYFKDQLAESEACLRRAMEHRKRILGPEARATLISSAMLGMVEVARGEHAIGEQRLRDTLASQSTLHGPNDIDSLETLMWLATARREVGDLHEAERLLRDALERFRLAAGRQNPTTVQVLNHLAAVLEAQDRLAEIAPELREVVEHQPLVIDANDGLDIQPQVPFAMAFLALTLLDQQTLEASEEAEAILRHCLDAHREIFRDDHPGATWRPYIVKSILGASLSRQARFMATVDSAAAQSKFQEAESLLLDVNEHMVAPPPFAFRLKQNIEYIVELYEAWNAVAPHPELAERVTEWRAKLSAE